MGLVKSGSNARFLCISKDQLVKVPPKVVPDRAVCLAETYLTAFQALHLDQTKPSVRYRNKCLNGRSILILEGYSSLGRSLIEVSLASGVNRCYALAKADQHKIISRLGAIPLSHNPQQWLKKIKSKIDVIVAVKDYRDLYTERVTKDHLKTLTNDGRVVVIGQPGVDNSFSFSLVVSEGDKDGNKTRKQQKPLEQKKEQKIKKTAESYNVFDSQEADPKQTKRDLEHLLGLLEHNKLAPEVLDLVSLSKVATVQSILESKRVTGHVVCTPWATDSS